MEARGQAGHRRVGECRMTITSFIGAPDVSWEVSITKDGIWPTTWRWEVRRKQENPYDYKYRFGTSLTKDRARRKALKVKRSIEDDDVKEVYRRSEHSSSSAHTARTPV